jgi:hypothetical protein
VFYFPASCITNNKNAVMILQVLLHIAAGYVLPKAFGGQERPVLFFDNGMHVNPLS